MADGRLECLEGRAQKPMRTVHRLTEWLAPRPAGEGVSGTLVMSVRTGPLEPGEAGAPGREDTWTGFLVGVGGPHVDYRTSALCHHWPGEDGGLIAALDGRGRLVLRDNADPSAPRGPRAGIPLSAWPLLASSAPLPGAWAGSEEGVLLELRVEPEDAPGEGYVVRLTAREPGGGALVTAALEGVPAGRLAGNLALVSHRSPLQGGAGYWFRDWRARGSLLASDGGRAFGPVMCALHTLSGGVLKLTAQLGPLGPDDAREVWLERLEGDRWQPVARAPVDPLSCTATFRVPGWDASRDVPYRLAYALRTGPGRSATHYYGGTVRRPPRGDELVLAGLSCADIASGGEKHWNGNHYWFPHAELTARVAAHDPDLLFFAGDQIYEGGLAGIVTRPTELAALDYLYHWYRWCWAFRDLARDRPTVCLPDDHDVYHGNIWGAGGERAEPGPRFRRDTDRGGYRMPPEWVNAVHRTQVAHLPDPVDPAPLGNGISVYFTSMEYGGLSFALLADRMWKSSPTVAVPEGEVVNGWFQAEGFDPVTQADVPGAVLLGERQLAFLERWAADWPADAWMKVVLSQTIFANVATLPSSASGDGVVPGLAYAEPGGYVEGDALGADCDSNGWPQSGRNRALAVLRKGFAFHVAGDQHLPSFVQYGIDEHGDAPFAFCVPAVANLWPRRWYPPEPGAGRLPGEPRYAGRHRDGFGNLMTVHAVANPVRSGVPPAALNDRNPGYGIVRFRRSDRTVTSECWPRWVDPLAPDAAQFAGWPVTVRQEENYGRRPLGHLPEVWAPDWEDPVVAVEDESSGELVYALRIRGRRFRPPVFEPGRYTVTVRGPDGEEVRFEGLSPLGPGEERTIEASRTRDADR